MSIAKRLKRRMPTVIAVIVLLAVWETWVDLGHVSPTMISAPSEIFRRHHRNMEHARPGRGNHRL